MTVVRSNLPEFSAALREIRNDLQQKSVVAATRSAANVFMKAARENSPKRSGMLSRALYVSKSRRVKGYGASRFFIAVRGGSRRKVNKKSGAVTDAFYWRWQEAGWVPRGPGQKLNGGDRYRAIIRSRGKKIPGKWFIRDAFKSAQTPAIYAFYERLDAAIRRYNAK